MTMKKTESLPNWLELIVSCVLIGCAILITVNVITVHIELYQLQLGR